MTETVSATPDPTPAPESPCADDARDPRRRRDRGEGVISAAIAVLIVAFLGAAMWVGFNTIWESAEQDITKQVDSIGG